MRTVSLLAAILLLALAMTLPAQTTAPATASASAPAPTGPRLIVNDADPAAAKNVALETLAVDVQIAGPLAQTNLTLTFRNHTKRVLETEFEMPLPEGAAVVGYALDVNGILVDGVPVEKNRARQIVESEIRRGVDPGLLEQTKGNNFRTRIYPLPAGGTRTVRITYVQDLVSDKDALVYRLPLTLAGAIKSGEIKLTVNGATAVPTVAGLGTLAFVEKNGLFVAQQLFANVELRGELVVRVPARADTLTLVERRTKVLDDGRTRDEHYFFVRPAKPIMGVLRKKDAPTLNHLAIYWDASLSREAADKTADLALVQKLVSWVRDGQVDVIAFRDTPDQPVTFAVKNGDGAAVIEHLKSLVYDGATALDAVTFKAGPDIALLFTDGLATLGEEAPAKAPLPVYTVSSTPGANHAVLHHIADSSGGAYLNLQRVTVDAAALVVEDRKFNVAEATFDKNQIADVYPKTFRVGQGDTITGRLLADEATLNFTYPLTNEKVAVTLKRGNAVPGDIVSRFWAQKKIDGLAALPIKNADELLKLGRDFNMVTPNTSLMVLETIDQYLRHGIAPPRSHPALFKEFNDRIEDEAKKKPAQQEEKITRVLKLWDERVKWWQQDFKVAKDFRVATTAPATEPLMNEGASTTPRVFYGGGSRGAATPTSQPARAGEALGLGGTRGDVETSRVPLSRQVQDIGQQAAAIRSLPPQNYRSVEVVTSPTESLRQSIDSASADAAVRVNAYDPKTPYIEALKRDPAKAYAVYLEQRKTYREQPGFYVDCADFLLKNNQRDLALRILSNVVELQNESVPLLRIAAYRFLQVGALDMALDLFEKTRRLRPDEPQSHRDLALAYAERGLARRKVAPVAGAEDLKLALARFEHVIMTPWPRFDEIETIALIEANRLWAEMQRLPQRERILSPNPLDPRLIKNLDLDLRIAMTWDADSTDIDLHVLEPSGQEAFFGQNRTQIGGLVSRDFTQGYGPEEYLIKKAQPGTYKIRAKFYGSQQQKIAGPVTVQATIITNFGRSDEQRQAITLRLADAKEMIDIGEVTIK